MAANANKGWITMNYFWDTVETIPEGVGFSHYGGLHLVWLAVAVVVVTAFCLIYRRLGSRGRTIWRRSVAVLLMADELFKLIPMLITGRFLPDYLPFHLCSVNLFLIAWHAWKPNRMLDNFLYTVCIPGALAALLFPSWTELPAANYMVIHSFTVHILLVMYPIVLSVGGDISPRLKELPKSLLLLVALGCGALLINLLLDTNFMFLMEAEEGNPLKIFETLWGNHLLGLPVIIAAVIVVMHLPWVLYRKLKKKSAV